MSKEPNERGTGEKMKIDPKPAGKAKGTSTVVAANSKKKGKNS